MTYEVTTWRTRDGRVIPIAAMDDDHLRNASTLLERTIQSSVREANYNPSPPLKGILEQQRETLRALESEIGKRKSMRYSKNEIIQGFIDSIKSATGWEVTTVSDIANCRLNIVFYIDVHKKLDLVYYLDEIVAEAKKRGWGLGVEGSSHTDRDPYHLSLKTSINDLDLNANPFAALKKVGQEFYTIIQKSEQNLNGDLFPQIDAQDELEKVKADAKYWKEKATARFNTTAEVWLNAFQAVFPSWIIETSNHTFSFQRAFTLLPENVARLSAKFTSWNITYEAEKLSLSTTVNDSFIAADFAKILNDIKTVIDDINAPRNSFRNFMESLEAK